MVRNVGVSTFDISGHSPLELVPLSYSTANIVSPRSARSSTNSTIMQTVNITTHYCWDQNDKNIILYIPIPKADELKKESYTLNVQPRSLQFGVNDHQGVNYNFKISNLCRELETSVSQIKLKPKKVILHLQKKEIGKHWNDIKAKKIGDVYSQMQRQIDASQGGRSEPMTNDMEENIINGYGPPSIQAAIKGAFENASPTVRQAAEKMLSEQQQQQSTPGTTSNPFDVSDLASSTSTSSPLPHQN